jgi:hypothetical protein
MSQIGDFMAWSSRRQPLAGCSLLDLILLLGR